MRTVGFCFGSALKVSETHEQRTTPFSLKNFNRTQLPQGGSTGFGASRAKLAGAKFHSDSAVTTYGIQLRAWVDMQAGKLGRDSGSGSLQWRLAVALTARLSILDVLLDKQQNTRQEQRTTF